MAVSSLSTHTLYIYNWRITVRGLLSSYEYPWDTCLPLTRFMCDCSACDVYVCITVVLLLLCRGWWVAGGLLPKNHYHQQTTLLPPASPTLLLAQPSLGFDPTTTINACSLLSTEICKKALRSAVQSHTGMFSFCCVPGIHFDHRGPLLALAL